MSARPPLMTRALKSAIAYCKLMFDHEMSTVVPGDKPTPEALAWRREATEYQKLRKGIEPPARGCIDERPGFPPLQA